MQDYTGFYKSQARDFVIHHAQQAQQEVLAAVDLPGPQQLSTRKLSQLGIINRNTILYSAEHDPNTYTKVDAYLKHNFTKYQLERNVIQLFKYFRNHNIHNISFAYLDFCGELTNDLLQEIKYFLQFNCTDQARVSMTFSTCGWHNPLLKQKYYHSIHTIIQKHQPKDVLLFNGTQFKDKEAITVSAIDSILPTNQNNKKSKINQLIKYVEEQKTKPMIVISLTVRNDNPSANYTENTATPNINELTPSQEGQYYHTLHKQGFSDSAIAQKLNIRDRKQKINLQRVNTYRKLFHPHVTEEQRIQIDAGIITMSSLLKKLKTPRNYNLQTTPESAIIPPTDNNVSQEKENIMSTKTPKQLAEQLILAEKSNSAGKKAAAKRAINQYVQRKVDSGSDETRIRAGVGAIVTRLRNGN